MPENPDHMKALALHKEGKYAEAIPFLDKAIKAEPNNPNIYNDRGISFLHTSQKQKALADMEKAVELEPDYAYRYCARAYVKDSLGDTQAAVDDYLIAVKLEPDDAIALNNLGLLEEKLGYQQKAQRRFEKADALSKQNGMSTMNGNGAANGNESVKAAQPAAQEKTTEPASPERASTGDHVREMLKVFTKKEAFNDFLKFIRNGFKDKK